jgi:hypothetical protein
MASETPPGHETGGTYAALVYFVVGDAALFIFTEAK